MTKGLNPRKDRRGETVQLCYQPPMIATITAWDEARQLWQAMVTTPELGTPMEFREDFLEYLESEDS